MGKPLAPNRAEATAGVTPGQVNKRTEQEERRGRPFLSLSMSQPCREPGQHLGVAAGGVGGGLLAVGGLLACSLK